MSCRVTTCVKAGDLRLEGGELPLSRGGPGARVLSLCRHAFDLCSACLTTGSRGSDASGKASQALAPVSLRLDALGDPALLICDGPLRVGAH